MHPKLSSVCVQNKKSGRGSLSTFQFLPQFLFFQSTQNLDLKREKLSEWNLYYFSYPMKHGGVGYQNNCYLQLTSFIILFSLKVTRKFSRSSRFCCLILPHQAVICTVIYMVIPYSFFFTGSVQIFFHLMLMILEWFRNNWVINIDIGK